MAKQLSIIGINIRNFKRIETFNATLSAESGLITIGGENANGKSSVIDAIYSALVGVQRNITNPVRDGEEEAAIRVLIGSQGQVEYKVIRKFSKSGKPAIVVQNGDGDTILDGASVLKELLGSESVDPVAFIHMQPKDQRDTLSRIVGLDIAQFDNQIEEARAREKELDRHQKTLEARVSELPWFEDAPEQELSAADLTAELQRANEHNQQGVTLRSRVAIAEQELSAAHSALNQNQSEQERLEREIAELTARLNSKRTEASLLAERVTEKIGLSNKAQEALAEFQPIDLSPITARMGDIEQVNQKVRANAAKIRAREEWQRAEDELKAQVATVKRIQDEKKKALSEAKFPVPGLEFDATQIIYNGQPFAQCSMAERIRVATSICIAQRKRLCPIFIRDASTLDNRSLSIIAEIAEQHGAQVIAEIVANQDESGEFDKDCTFYVVDGTKYEVPTVEHSTNGAVQEALL